MDSSYSQLYGLRTPNLQVASDEVGAILRVEWTLRNGLESGDYCTHGEFDSEFLSLYRNHNVWYNEPFEPKFADFPMLLYVRNTARSAELTTLLTQQNVTTFEIVLLYTKPTA